MGIQPMTSLRIYLIAVGVMALAVMPGCEASAVRDVNAQFNGTYPIQATVTVGMIADIVRAIGGQHVEVTQLMAADVDPHTFKPLRDDVLAIRAADIVFYNGLLLEGKMAEVLERIANTRRSLAVAETLDPQAIATDEAGAHHPDPHVWMDVSLWKKAAEELAAELVRFDPSHADDYQAGYQSLAVELDALHAYGQQMVGCVPERQRVLVTSHDAFQYFGRAYGLEVEAVQGISTESEAGLNRINQLVDMLVERQVASVFVESSVSEDSIVALIRGAASRGHQVEIAAKLYSDAMGEAGSYEGTYVGMMDHNLTTIARALGCTNVPAEGFRQLQTP